MPTWPSLASGASARPRASQPVRIVEYYNAALDHYFITWVPDEIAKLDDGIRDQGLGAHGHESRARTRRRKPAPRRYAATTFRRLWATRTSSAAAPRNAMPPGRTNPSFVLEDPQFMQMFLPALGTCPGEHDADLSRVQQSRRTPTIAT